MDRLEIRNVSRQFSTGFALEDLSLSLAPGEVLALVGQNGCGKSALLKILAGLIPADQGGMVLDSSEFDLSLPRHHLIPGISLQAQELEVFDNLSVEENIYLSSFPKLRFLPFIMDRRAMHRSCEALFSRLGIRLDPLAKVSTLGYAQKLLISVISTCIADQKVYLMDEPSAGMTEPERDALILLVKELTARGASVMYVTHRLDELPRLADRVGVMQQGRLVAMLTMAEVQRNRLINLMTGKLCPERYPRTPVTPGPVRISVRELHSGPALEGVSFEVRAGEVVGVTGLMGSGRTRLASCLFGSIRPDKGSISIDHDAVFFRHPEDALQRGLAMIPEDRQESGLFHQLDLVKNMTSASLGRFRQGVGLDEEYMEELAGQYVDSLGIRPGLGKGCIDEYSGGNQQKVIIARWLMSMASMYIMDEPTRGIDPAARVDIYNTMNDLASKGAALLLLSSDVEELLGMCDRILVLCSGRIIASFTRENATKEAILDAASSG